MRILAAFKDTGDRTLYRRVVWQRLAAPTVLAAYLYAALEWIFFVTKPSFMDLMHFGEKLEILMLPGLAVALPGLILLLICAGSGKMLSYLGVSSASVVLGALIPTFILSADVLLMIDNFTYVVLGFGIISSDGLWRGLYALAFVILLAYIYKRVFVYLYFETDAREGRGAAGMSFYAAGVLLLTSLVWADVRFTVSGSAGLDQHVRSLEFSRIARTSSCWAVMGWMPITLPYMGIRARPLEPCARLQRLPCWLRMRSPTPVLPPAQ